MRRCCTRAPSAPAVAAGSSAAALSSGRQSQQRTRSRARPRCTPCRSPRPSRRTAGAPRARSGRTAPSSPPRGRCCQRAASTRRNAALDPRVRAAAHHSRRPTSSPARRRLAGVRSPRTRGSRSTSIRAAIALLRRVPRRFTPRGTPVAAQATNRPRGGRRRRRRRRRRSACRSSVWRSAYRRHTQWRRVSSLTVAHGGGVQNAWYASPQCVHERAPRGVGGVGVGAARRRGTPRRARRRRTPTWESKAPSPPVRRLGQLARILFAVLHLRLGLALALGLLLHALAADAVGEPFVLRLHVARPVGLQVRLLRLRQLRVEDVVANFSNRQLAWWIFSFGRWKATAPKQIFWKSARNAGGGDDLLP